MLVKAKVKSPLANPVLAALDRNGDGKVDRKDLIAVLDRNGDGKVDRKDLIAVLDRNGDGKVDRKDGEEWEAVQAWSPSRSRSTLPLTNPHT